MGVCCSQEKGEKKYDAGQDLSLPLQSPMHNAFDNLNRQFPLAVTHVEVYFKKVYEIEGDEFTPKDMAAKFTTKAWTDPEWVGSKRGHTSMLTDPNSVFRKFLATLPNCSEDKLSKKTMLCIGLLWCQGGKKQKAEQLFNLVNPPGQSQETIASNDKDWNITLKTLFQISLECTLNFVHEHVNSGDAAFNDYDQSLFERAYKAMHKFEGDDKAATGYIDGIYGYESYFDKKTFIEHATQVTNTWIFDDQTVREHMKNKFGTEELLDDAGF